MIALVFVLLAVIALAARLVTDVRQDRPTSSPRSHAHELDPHSARLLRVI